MAVCKADLKFRRRPPWHPGCWADLQAGASGASGAMLAAEFKCPQALANTNTTDVAPVLGLELSECQRWSFCCLPVEWYLRSGKVRAGQTS